MFLKFIYNVYILKNKSFSKGLLKHLYPLVKLTKTMDIHRGFLMKLTTAAQIVIMIKNRQRAKQIHSRIWVYYFFA
jgi:hypothetical protein